MSKRPAAGCAWSLRDRFLLLAALFACAVGGAPAQTEAELQERWLFSMPVGLSAELQAGSAAGLPVTFRYRTPEGEERRSFFVEARAEEQRQAALRVADALRDADGRIPAEVTDGNGNPRSMVRDGMPFRFHDPVTRHPLPIWWLPKAARAPHPALDEAENARRKQHALALKRGRDGLTYEGPPLPGVWVFYDEEHFQEHAWLSRRAIVSKGTMPDHRGNPMVRIDIARRHQMDFEDYTKQYVGKPLCLVSNGAVVTSPIVNAAIAKSLVISGGVHGFTDQEVRALLETFDDARERSPQAERRYEWAKTMAGVVLVMLIAL